MDKELQVISFLEDADSKETPRTIPTYEEDDDDDWEDDDDDDDD